VYDKSSETLPNNYSAGLKNEFLFGSCNEELVVVENDVKFYIDFINGQKTGFLLINARIENYLVSIVKESVF